MDKIAKNPPCQERHTWVICIKFGLQISTTALRKECTLEFWLQGFYTIMRKSRQQSVAQFFRKREKVIRRKKVSPFTEK